MGWLSLSLGALPLLWAASHVVALIRNYRWAKETGLKLVFFYFDPDNVLYQLLCVPCRPIFKLLLPKKAFDVVELTLWGWEFRDKAAIHDRHGSTFMLVTTGVNRIITSDPTLTVASLTRWKEFPRPDVTAKVMGFLGDNIFTAGSESWGRHRHIVSGALSERIIPDVWGESATQAAAVADMVTASHDSSSTEHEYKDALPGVRRVAINVLARVGYGKQQPFTPPSTTDKGGPGKLTYADGIELCVDLLLWAAFIPSWMLKLPFVPRIGTRMGYARDRLPGLAKQLLDDERAQERSNPEGSSRSSGRETIVQSLVRLSDQEKDFTSQTGAKGNTGSINRNNRSFLTEDEIAGNLFVFTAAAYDTTANTMMYAITLLAAYPQWQAWMQAEVDAVLGDASTARNPLSSADGYAASFPKLTRCLALMYETLRLYPPVCMLLREAKPFEVLPTSKGSSDSIRVPPNVRMYLNVMAIQSSKSNWGDDALEFNPARWLPPPAGKEAPQLLSPPRGTFLSWATGPRSCPGQKMSQVEFVAVISTLFHGCNVEPLPRPGQTLEEARENLLDLTQDSQVVLALQMNRAKDIRLRWTKR